MGGVLSSIWSPATHKASGALAGALLSNHLHSVALGSRENLPARAHASRLLDMETGWSSLREVLFLQGNCCSLGTPAASR